MGAREDSASIDRLLRHSDWLQSLARRLARDEAAAEDLVQEAWVAALRHPPKPGASVRAWLTTVGRRLVRRQAWRRVEPRELEQLEQDGADVRPAEDVVARIEQERRLAGLVLALEEPYREVVLQRYYRGRTAAQIAHDQGVPAATVRTRLRRALALLRERLDGTHGGDGRSWLLALAPLLHDTGKGAMLMGTKTVAISVLTGAICAVAVTEGALPLLRQAPPAELSAAREPEAAPAAAEGGPSARAGSAPGKALVADAAEQRASERVALPVKAPEPSTGELHALLGSSKRLDQVRAITLLLQQGTPEASAILLDAYLGARDPVLVGLLEEALLASPVDMAPALMEAYAASDDPATLRRLSGMLPKVARAHPELADEIVGLFVGALESEPTELTNDAVEALVAMGASALDGLGRYVADPASSLEGTGSAAFVMAQLPPEQGDALRAQLSEGLAAALAAPDPLLTAEEQAAGVKKAGSLAWAASLRPPEEHDRLGEVLVDNLLKVGDPAQAGTLGWGVANLKGMTGSARVRMSESLLDALSGQVNGELKQQYVRLVGQLAQGRPVDESHYDLLAVVERAQALQQSDPALSAQLAQLAAELHAQEQAPAD